MQRYSFDHNNTRAGCLGIRPRRQGLGRKPLHLGWRSERRSNLYEWSSLCTCSKSRLLMKKLLLASTLAIASFPGFAADQPVEEEAPPLPPARITVQPSYQGPPPIGWVYGPYTQCGNPPQCSMGVVNVDASGLNVRVTPNGPPVMALVNGTPLY